MDLWDDWTVAAQYPPWARQESNSLAQVLLGGGCGEGRNELDLGQAITQVVRNNGGLRERWSLVEQVSDCCQGGIRQDGTIPTGTSRQ